MTRPAFFDSTAERRERRKRLRRIARRTVYVAVALACVGVVVASGVYLRLVAGPVSLQDYSGDLRTALAERIGPGWQVGLRDTNLELYDGKPAVQVSGLELRNPAGLLVLRAPHALVSFDPASLLAGRLSPRAIALRDLQIRALAAADGSLSFAVQDETGPDAPTARAAGTSEGGVGAGPASGGAAASPVSLAVASLLDPVLRPTSLIGSLDRATVTNARLTLVGPDGADRAVFSRVGARFERRDAGERRIELDFEGGHGSWRVQGGMRDGPERTVDLAVEGLPLTDLLLLTGMRAAPNLSDLKLDGRLGGSLAAGRLSRLEGRFASSEGVVRRPGRPDLRVESAAGRASWDETRRALTLAGVEVRSEGSAIRLEGELASRPTGEWRLQLAGRDAVVAGLTAAEPAFRIDTLAVELSFGPASVTLDRAIVKGRDLDLTMSGGSVPGPDGTGVSARIEASRTDVRRLVRLWPDVLSNNLRGFLVDNLRSGLVETFALTASVDGRDLKRALADEPIPDEALGIDFVLKDAVLALADGLPPLRDLQIEGKISGANVRLSSRGGRVDLPEGRRLTFADGSYRQSDYDMKDSVARIGFRVTGGADAFVAFLRSPTLREAGAPDLDPAAFRGRGDVRVTLPLTVHRIPSLSGLPFSIQGSASDLSVEKLVGREKVEGGQFSVGYEGGAFSMRGEARLSGSPANIELLVPRTGPGAATIQLTLDEAARARRGLPVAPSLGGPVAAKVTAALGGGAKTPPPRVEVDLARASVDNLVPGWTKPAGRPGRLSFQLVEADGTELRDLVLDAGATQIKGQVSLLQGGGLDRADLVAFKLSPGDDLRAQVERAGSGYLVAIKGNVGDARPVLKWMGAAASGPATAAQKSPVRDAPDVDLDLAVNILTGHNDEALTGVSARLSSRNRDLKALQLSARTPSGPIEARLAKLDGGAPVLSVGSSDAGAVLRFLDLYRRMVGGKLALEARMGEAGQEGTITIDNFTLRGEPALKRLVSESVPVGTQDRNGGPAERINPNDVQFVKLTGGFRRNASRIDYQDVVIWGSQVGFNLSGFVDYGRDRTDISGTYVPAYTLNNAFSQIPVIGLILGGGANEGLFAIEFRISGQASAPTVTINPLSAVAPGILRKLFGWMLPEGEEPAAETGAPRPKTRER